MKQSLNQANQIDKMWNRGSHHVTLAGLRPGQIIFFPLLLFLLLDEQQSPPFSFLLSLFLLGLLVDGGITSIIERHHAVELRQLHLVYTTTPSIGALAWRTVRGKLTTSRRSLPKPTSVGINRIFHLGTKPRSFSRHTEVQTGNPIDRVGRL